MTCPLTTPKLMLICSGSLMPFTPRVSVIVCLSDYTCTLTSTSCGKDLDYVRANPSIPQVGKFSAGSDMVPQALPPPLQNLCLLEKQLIALAHPIARVVRLKGGVQYGYRGHILNVASTSRPSPHLFRGKLSRTTWPLSSSAHPEVALGTAANSNVPGWRLRTP